MAAHTHPPASIPSLPLGSELTRGLDSGPSLSSEDSGLRHLDLDGGDLWELGRSSHCRVAQGGVEPAARVGARQGGSCSSHPISRGGCWAEKPLEEFLPGAWALSSVSVKFWV